MIYNQNLNKILSLLLLCLLLSSCADRTEVETSAYILAVGLDKSPNDNSDNIQVTYLIANPEYGTEQQGGGAPPNAAPAEIISFEASDIISAENIANAVIAKDVTYNILRAFVVSEEFAKTDNFMRWMYDITKGIALRRDINFLVTKEDPLTFFEKNQPVLESRMHKYFKFVFEQDTKTGQIPNSVVNDLFRITAADGDLFLAIYATAEQSDQPLSNPANYKAGEFPYEGRTNFINYGGSAVFKKGKMIGTLTTEETKLSILLKRTLSAEDMLFILEDPFNDAYEMTIKVEQREKADVQVDIKNDTITVDLPLAVDVLTNHSMVDFADSTTRQHELKESIRSQLHNKIEKLIKKTKEELKGNPFAWSLAARKQFLTIPKYKAYNWMEKYPDMDVKVSVDIRVENVGRQVELPKMKE
ncbi:Ger(x)C family spore germination C-terminal domain-containing protein [Virgibacillus soli]|uniref:Ger(x)C family spore germination C-terminal domain-containing protein n=1 Tax=Paracerasibacillus soli TaxID=480284 RepID=UPI0035E5B19F